MSHRFSTVARSASHLDPTWYPVLAMLCFQGAAAVEYNFSSEPPPANTTTLTLTSTNKGSKNVIKKTWTLPNDATKVAMYSEGHSKRRSIVVQPVAQGFGTYRVTLIDAAKGFGGGKYDIKIPQGQANCTLDLHQKGMDVSSVSVW